MLRTLTLRLIVTALIPALLLTQGCTVMGYSAGRIIDIRDRVAVPSTEIENLKNRQTIWVTLDDGTVHVGRLEGPGELVDALTLRGWRDYGRAAPDTIPLTMIHEIAIPRSSSRWWGLGLGAAVDLMFFSILVTQDRNFKPAFSKE